MAKKRRVTSLKDVRTHEVSLVESGANLKRRFPIMKAARGNTMKMEDILVEVLKAEGRSEAIAKLEEDMEKMELPEDAKAAISAAMKLLESFSDMMPVSDALQALRTANGEKVEVEIEASEEEEAEKAEHEDEEMKKEDEEEELKKSLGELPDAARAAVEALWKSNRELVEKSQKLESELGQELAKRERGEFIAKSEKSLCNIPGHSLEEVCDLVLEAKARDADFGARIEKALTAASNGMKGGATLVEAGSNAPVEAPGDAWGRIQQLAQEEIQKSQGKMDMPVAIAKAIQTNPKLYAEYQAERVKKA
ncbi:MAG: hypothetical protein ACO38Q_05575 [Aquiluna sp.]